jgi:O-antigen ligase
MSFEQNKLWDNIFLLIAIFTIFIAESRAGLAAALILATGYWIRRPRDVALIVTTAAVLIPVIVSVTSAEGASVFTPRTLERATTLLQPTEAESLSGRDLIWTEHIAYLNEQPTRWLTGVGFGMAKGIGSGSTAHMTYLHVIFETGLGGLLVFLALGWRILRFLWRSERGTKPLFWASIGLFVSAVAQETFYPLPSLGHFLGFYLAVLAIALRKTPMPVESVS